VIHRGVSALERRRLHHRVVSVKVVLHVGRHVRCTWMKGVRRAVMKMRRRRRWPPERSIVHPRIERRPPEVWSARSSIHRNELAPSRWWRLLNNATSMRWIVVPRPRGIVRGTTRLRGLVPVVARTALLTCRRRLRSTGNRLVLRRGSFTIVVFTGSPPLRVLIVSQRCHTALVLSSLGTANG
jgi:hypothetical protein